ncbi:MAG: hypothetical protein GDA49_05370 [Rhodospirillales bacterium]|nr:hypothetical protein [Rhodospirillales bacterium]
MRALKTPGATRIVVATPYPDEVNRIEAHYVAAQGFDIPDIQALNIENDVDMVRVTPDYLLEYGTGVGRPETEAILMICGTLQSMEIIDAL